MSCQGRADGRGGLSPKCHIEPERTDINFTTISIDKMNLSYAPRLLWLSACLKHRLFSDKNALRKDGRLGKRTSRTPFLTSLRPVNRREVPHPFLSTLLPRKSPGHEATPPPKQTECVQFIVLFFVLSRPKSILLPCVGISKRKKPLHFSVQRLCFRGSPRRT